MKSIQIYKSFTNRDEESLAAYFRDVNKFKLLTQEEEINIARQAKQGDEIARNKLITANLRFVISVAKQYQGQGLRLADLINEGNAGLITASHLYDPERGIKFISYAVWWIRQSILKAIYYTGRTIRYPVTQVGKLLKINRAISKLETKLGRKPTIDEVAEETEFEPEVISSTLKYVNRCSSSDELVNDNNESITVGDLIPGYFSTDNKLEEDSKLKEINIILSHYGNREQDIVRMFFGLGMQELTLEEIANRFGMTSERMRQLKEKTLKDMKEHYSKELKSIL